jgi:hypothetical protein
MLPTTGEQAAEYAPDGLSDAKIKEFVKLSISQTPTQGTGFY